MPSEAANRGERCSLPPDKRTARRLDVGRRSVEAAREVEVPSPYNEEAPRAEARRAGGLGRRSRLALDRAAEAAGLDVLHAVGGAGDD